MCNINRTESTKRDNIARKEALEKGKHSWIFQCAGCGDSILRWEKSEDAKLNKLIMKVF